MIEDFDDPIILTDLKEIEVNNVSPGQDVEVTTDATEEGDFAKGKVVSINDVAQSSGMQMNSSGSVNNNGGGDSQSSSSKFEAKIKLDNPKGNESIKVGMSAKANIILDKRLDVFSVPFSCILEEDDGKYIEILVEAEEGKYQVKKIKIETGLESTSEVEVSSSELNEGDNIIMEPAAYNDGEIVVLGNSGGGEDKNE